MLRTRCFSFALAGLLALGVADACSRRAETPVAAAPVTPEFESQWQLLVAAGAEVVTVADDRGEALLGSVRRARREPAATAPAPGPAQPVPAAAATGGAAPQGLPGDEVHRVIRSNLAGVKSCYLAMARQGVTRSGKAIVSFAVGADGRPAGVRIEAPSFHGTALPTCITTRVSMWSFPRSDKGSPPVSYPFVFVGG